MLRASRRFGAGLSAALRGCRRALGSARVRRMYGGMVLAVLGLTAALDAAGIWAVVRWTALDGASTPWWTAGLLLARVAGIAIVLLAAPVAALFLARIAFPFLGDRVFLAAMDEVAPERARRLAASDGLPVTRSILYNVVRLALLLLLGAAALALGFVPLVGIVLGPALQGYVAARSLGWELLDPYLDRLRMGFGEQRAYVRRHRPAIVGFALPYTLLLAVPLAGPFVFGVAQAAAATLVAEALEPDGDGPAPRAPGV